MNDCAFLIALVIICCSLAAVHLIVTGHNPLHPVADELEMIIQHTLGIDEPTELKEMHIRILSEIEKHLPIIRWLLCRTVSHPSVYPPVISVSW